MLTQNDLDEVLSRNTDGKINWIVAEVTDMKQDISIIKSNHLFHIEKDMATMKKSSWCSRCFSRYCIYRHTGDVR